MSSAPPATLRRQRSGQALARVELATWHNSLGFAEAADMLGELSPIGDSDTYDDNWPTSVHRSE